MPRKSDSQIHNEERRAKMKEETVPEVSQEITREQAARERDIQFLEQQASIVKQTDTREVIMERIRRMREEKPKEYEPPPLSAADKERLEREQANGRAAVAAAEAAAEANREIARKAMEAEKARNLTPELTPLIYPNPTQEDEYPASNATLGKKK